MRRILGFVVLPTLAGVRLVVCRYLYLSQQVNFPQASVFQGGTHNEPWGFSTVWSLGPAVHMSALGLIFILIFLGRLATGKSPLPISLAHFTSELSGSDERWRRLLLCVWFSTVGMSALSLLASLSVVDLYRLVGHSLGYRSLPSAVAPPSSALSTAVLAGAAAWAVGRDRWTEFRRFVRPAESKFVALSVIFPIAIRFVLDLVAYTSDRVRWAAFHYGSAALLLFTSYFRLPNSHYLWYMIAAGFEEVIWRGFLQPRFVKRYGMMRGIFLVGLAWAAFHFTLDFRHTTEDYQIALRFAFRIADCIAMSYVLGWLTLRSGSIWPAALAHGLNNIWAFSAG
jgi:membrane protease YdiL (CAAX protease family)